MKKSSKFHFISLKKSCSWDLITKNRENKLDVTVNIPSNAAIGRYSVKFFIIDAKQNEYRFFPAEKIYIIANPFDENGGCYYPSNIYKDLDFRAFLREYCFNEEGKVYLSRGYG